MLLSVFRNFVQNSSGYLKKYVLSLLTQGSWNTGGGSLRPTKLGNSSLVDWLWIFSLANLLTSIWYYPELHNMTKIEIEKAHYEVTELV